MGVREERDGCEGGEGWDGSSVFFDLQGQVQICILSSNSNNY